MNKNKNKGGKDKKKTANSTRFLWIWFTFFCIALGVIILVVEDPMVAISYAWIALEMSVLIMDVILLIKHKLPKKGSVISAIILAILVLASYIDVSIVKHQPAWFNLLVDPLLTLLSSLACFSIFEKYKKKSGRIFKQHEVEPVMISVLIGCVVGVVLGIVNILLMMGKNESHVQYSIHNFLVALSPAVFEEIALRSTFWAVFLSLNKESESNKKQKFTCMFMMIVPHVLIHTPGNFIRGGLINGLIATALYIVLYGVAFAFLQKKRDIASAMIAHGVVDTMRFCFFGLPF